jgi:T5SS/PEP-CTERM-associated repeat protein
MHRMRYVYLIAAFFAGMVFSSRPVRAQYSADFQTNVISGVVSNWSGDYYVGYTNFADVLLVRNGGALFDGGGYVGFPSNSINNSVLVADAGSAWQNTNGPLFMIGTGNSLVISNQGQVFSTSGGVGGSNNSVVVTGSGSTWNTGSTGSTSFIISSVGGPGNSVVIINSGRVDASECDMSGCDPVGDLLLVSGVGSILNDTGSLVIGTGVATYGGLCSTRHSLVVSNGGQVLSVHGYAGVLGSNSVLVTGSGSVWRNSLDLYVGSHGSGNSLVVSNGGQMINGTSFSPGGGGNCYIGGDPNLFPTGANSNSVVVTGTSSVWSNFGPLSVGYDGAGNSLVIGNSGLVNCACVCDVGFSSISSNNTVRVIDGGVLRFRNNNLIIGFQGSSNSLVVAGGSVFAPNLYIGYASAFCNNFVELDSGSLAVTNSSAVLEVRMGTLILNGGVLQVGKLVITNPCASFVHTGGTLIAGSVVLDPNAFRITSLTRSGNDILVTWMMGPGQTNALQATAGGSGGSYTTNGFSDIFVVTNNIIPGTVTNYLDVGGATNVPSRYYRVRLAP